MPRPDRRGRRRSSWHEHSIQLGDVAHGFAPGRTLSVKITVAGEAGDDMWFAYVSSAYPSRLTGAAASDIVIDGSFGDWLDGDGAQIHVEDEGGPDDWGSSEQSCGDRLIYDGTTGQATLVSALGSTWLVRRSASPWDVRAAEPVAAPLAAPFDDLPGTLDDGQLAYYVVEREWGVPVSISAHANTASRAVRLGFDDLDADSAPADASLSRVSVSGASAQADGTSSVTVTVIPRDAQGVMLGAGCAVSVDAAALAPGLMAGPVVDQFNGRYSFRVVATSPGIAGVYVTVEGVPLDEAPRIDFGL